MAAEPTASAGARRGGWQLPAGAGAAAGLLLAPIAASTVGARGGPLSAVATLAFCAALVAFAFRRGTAVPGAVWFLLLAPGYFATFLAHPPVLTTADHVFNTDPFRYLAEAASFTIQPRHIGMPVVTFARIDFGVVVTLLPGALAGALAVAVLFRLAIRLGVPGALALPAALGLASTLAFWTFASLVESHVFSTLLLLLLLEVLLLEARPPVVPLALLSAAALGFSLENLYVPFFVAAFLIGRALVDRTNVGPALGSAGLYLLLAGALFAAWLSATAALAGPGFFHTWGDQRFDRPADTLAENLTHFASETWDASRLLSLQEQSEVAVRTFVVAALAQPGTPPWRYGKAAGTEELLRPARLGWLLLVAALAGLAAAGLKTPLRSGGLHRLVVGWGVLLLLYRQAFIVAFSPREGLLFALPSLAVGTLLLALGLAGAARNPPFKTPGRRLLPVALAVGLAGAVLWQTFVNRGYLAEIATPGRFGL